MKLGGITWWRGNYGSILQAYALAHVINDLDGVEYEIIDQYGSIGSVQGVFSRLKGKSLSEIAKKAIYKIGSKKQSERTNAFEEFIRSYLPISTNSFTHQSIASANDIYDGFVCGSDQIWNFAIAKPDPIYWLAFAKHGKKKIAYAPSVGMTKLSKTQTDFVHKMLGDFDAISCREESGAKIIAEACGRFCKCVLDPTLLLSRTEWDELIDDSRYMTEDMPKRYVFAYILVGNQEQRSYVERYAHDRGLQVVSFPLLEPERSDPYDKSFGDIQVYDASPADFIRLISNAECVFTDSFHSSVFSAIYHKDFYIFEKFGAAQSERLDNLAKILGIGNRRITPKNADAQIISMKDVDWAQVDNRLNALRSSSVDYLRGSITGEVSDC